MQKADNCDFPNTGVAWSCGVLLLALLSLEAFGDGGQGRGSRSPVRGPAGFAPVYHDGNTARASRADQGFWRGGSSGKGVICTTVEIEARRMQVDKSDGRKTGRLRSTGDRYLVSCALESLRVSVSARTSRWGLAYRQRLPLPGTLPSVVEPPGHDSPHRRGCDIP